jgi:hypothetical protein
MMSIYGCFLIVLFDVCAMLVYTCILIILPCFDFYCFCYVLIRVLLLCIHSQIEITANGLVD